MYQLGAGDEDIGTTFQHSVGTDTTSIDTVRKAMNQLSFPESHATGNISCASLTFLMFITPITLLIGPT